MKKKLFVPLIVSIATLFCSHVFASSEDNINVTLNDEVVTFDSAPVIQNDRTLVPIRTIAEKLNFDVNWDQNTQTVTLENFNTILTLKINENSIKKDLKLASDNYTDKISNIELDVPATVLNDRTYIPLRAVTESFGCEVNWKQETNTAEIIYPNTYGKEVVFEDEGIEYLVKMSLAIEGIDTHPTTSASIPAYINSNIISKVYKGSADELYPLKIYEGALGKVESLGMIFSGVGYGITTPKICSLEDLYKLPNLKSLEIEANFVKDLSPISCIKEWDYLKLIKINQSCDLKVLKKVTINNALYINEAQFDNTDNILSAKAYIPLLDVLVEICDSYQKVIDENISENMTNKEKLVALSTWISNNIEYDYGYKSKNEVMNHYANLEGFIKYEKLVFDPTMLTHYGVCHNYSTILENFCDMLNIPCIYISGSCDGVDPYYNEGWGDHAWNVVKLEDGKFYHIDTTWGEEYMDFLTSEELKNFGDHTWNESNIQKGFEEKYGSDF